MVWDISEFEKLGDKIPGDFSITKRLIYYFILEKNQVYDNIVS